MPEFSNMAFFADKCWVLIPLMLLSILGGVGFVVIIDLIAKTRKKKKLNLHTRVVLLMSTILISVGFVLILAFEWNNPETLGSMSFGNKVVNAMFQSVVTRSSGFATFNFASLNPITQILCGVWMLIGGSPASMAGGLKTTTVFVLLLFIFKSTDQNGNIIYKNKKIPYTIVSKAMKIFLIVISSVLVGSTLVFAFEGGKIGFGAAFFEALASISTVGLSLGVTSFLGVGSKLVLSLMMFMGRIGMLTIPLAFKIKNQTAGIEYPDAKITVG